MIRIQSIQVFALPLPMATGDYVMSSGALTHVDSTVVRLTLSNGLAGWGETCPLGTTYAPASAAGARTALAQMIPNLIGQRAEVLALHRTMDAALNGLAYAKAALDIALHDALARTFGLSLSSFLGGAVRSNVPAYFAISCGEVDETIREAREAVSAGFRRLQIKVGGSSVGQDVERLRAVHGEVGQEIELVADANRGFTRPEALMFSQQLAGIPLTLEQPCDSLAEHHQIRARLCHPLCLDEDLIDLRTCFQALDVMDSAAMKMTRLGGLHPMRAFRDMAAARRLPHSVDDSWGGDIIAAAGAHMAATVDPTLLTGAWIAAPHLGEHQAETPVRVVDGQISVPPGPGLGLEIDPEQFGAPLFQA